MECVNRRVPILNEPALGMGAFFILSLFVSILLPTPALAEPTQGRVDINLAAKVAATNPKLSPHAIRNAFHFLAAHEDVFKNQDYMTIVNFDQPSTEERLYLINLKDGSTKRLLVSHGKNSAQSNDWKWAGRFSNIPKSKQSSLGFFRTLDKNEPVDFINSEGQHVVDTGVYTGGKHGRSMRLLGLQSSNSKALMRQIVVHGASYVSPSYVRAAGRLGQSHGCPAVENKFRDYVIDRTQGRSLFYIFKSDSKKNRALEEAAGAPPKK